MATSFVITIPVWVGLALALFMGRTDSVSLPFLSLARQVALLTLLPVGLGLVITHESYFFHTSA